VTSAEFDNTNGQITGSFVQPNPYTRGFRAVLDVQLEPGQSTMRHYHALSEEIYLLTSGGEAAYPSIEAEILKAAQGQDPSDLIYSAETYVRQRGPARSSASSIHQVRGSTSASSSSA
jgi:hypothetical protein